MEGSILGGPILSAPEAGVLELDPGLHHTASLHHQQALSHHLQGLAPLSSTQHLNLGQDLDSSLGFDPSKPLLLSCKGKSACSSDEEDPSFNEEGDCHLSGKGKKGSSPWQRMKWTDAMVKLLIHVVMYVGEDGGSEAAMDCSKKKAGMLQKKGKWKSVSRVMNEKGCYVSPQQCEDKFNDLNKRYKRLNDILGKGIACCVVEDPTLLDTMDSIPPKSKDDVRKILSSKQLFYKEICAYHSGCKAILPSVDFDPHRSVQGGGMSQSQDMGRQHQNGMDGGHHHEEEGDDDDDDDDDDDGEKDEDDGYEDAATGQPDLVCGFSARFDRHGKRSYQRPADGGLSSPLSKYVMAFGSDPPSNLDPMLATQDGIKPMLATQDGIKPSAEPYRLLSAHVMHLEEQKVGLLAQAIELERQRFKWERLSGKRRRESEQRRLDNKKMKLENERISLALKQKELEVEYKRSEASMSSIDLIIQRLQSKEPIEFGGPGQGVA